MKKSKKKETIEGDSLQEKRKIEVEDLEGTTLKKIFEKKKNIELRGTYQIQKINYEEEENNLALKDIIQLLESEIIALRAEKEKFIEEKSIRTEEWKETFLTMKNELSSTENELKIHNHGLSNRVKELKAAIDIKADLTQVKNLTEEKILSLKETVKNAENKISDLFAMKEREKIITRKELYSNIQVEIKQASKKMENIKVSEIETANKVSILQNFQMSWELEQQFTTVEKLVKENKLLEEKKKKMISSIETKKLLETQLEQQSDKDQRLICEQTKENENLNGILENFSDGGSTKSFIEPSSPIKKSMTPIQIRQLELVFLLET